MGILVACAFLGLAAPVGAAEFPLRRAESGRHLEDRRGVKPVLLLETHYENDWAGKTAEEVRRYPYRALLSGAAGHFFGNRPLWFSGTGWEAALDSPASRSMEHVGRLFRSRPWQKLVLERAGHFVASGGGDPRSDDGVQAARAADRSFAMAFLPSQRTIQIDVSRIVGPVARAWWFDICTGAATPGGEMPTHGLRPFTTPGSTGFVLVLDDLRRGHPPPGVLPLPGPASRPRPLP